MSARLCALVALCTPAVAAAQDTEPLPPRGWVLAEAASDAPHGPEALRVQVGAAFAVRPEVAIAVVASASPDRVSLLGGVTFEAGALYLLAAVGPDARLDAGAVGLGAELAAVVEVPPLPVYLETWWRVAVRRPFDPGTSDEWTGRSMLLCTLSRSVALGAELDLVGFPGLASAPLGPRLNVGLGRHLDLGAFAGFETVHAARPDTLVPAIGLVGRLTGVVAW